MCDGPGCPCDCGGGGGGGLFATNIGLFLSIGILLKCAVALATLCGFNFILCAINCSEGSGGGGPIYVSLLIDGFGLVSPNGSVNGNSVVVYVHNV